MSSLFPSLLTFIISHCCLPLYIIFSINWCFLFLPRACAFCTAISCGQLNDPVNGKVVVSGTTPGSTATYSCNDGFQLFGNTVRECQSNGHWSGSTPSCKSKNIFSSFLTSLVTTKNLLSFMITGGGYRIVESGEARKQKSQAHKHAQNFLLRPFIIKSNPQNGLCILNISLTISSWQYSLLSLVVSLCGNGGLQPPSHAPWIRPWVIHKMHNLHIQ